MEFKKIMLITFVLLAILTIGAVSAFDDANALEMEDEQVVEAPTDSLDGEVLGDPVASDFNVTITDKKIDVDDDSATVVSFDWPSYVGENDIVQVDVEGGSGPSFKKVGIETSRNVTLGELYIFDVGVYNITVNYNFNLELAKGTINVTKSSTQTLTADNFIELYDLSWEYPVNGSDGYLCTFSDSYSDNGLNGEAFVYIDNNIAYYTKFTGTGKVGSTVWGKNLTGTYDGNHVVKCLYKRVADGIEYSKQVTNNFINVVGTGTLPQTNTNINTNTNTNQQSSSSSQIVVNTLTLKKVTVKKSAKKLTLQATLKINGKTVKGKVVKFKFNKKSYSAKTNAKGIAKVTIKKAVLKKLKVGKSVKYQVSYEQITVGKSVKVKK